MCSQLCNNLFPNLGAAGYSFQSQSSESIYAQEAECEILITLCIEGPLSLNLGNGQLIKKIADLVVHTLNNES